MHPFYCLKPTVASKSKKNDSKFSPKTKTMTKPIQNVFTYSSLKGGQDRPENRTETYSINVVM